MAHPKVTSASVRRLSGPLARLLVPESVYAATLLLERINPAQVPARIKPLLVRARWEIRHGDVSEQTLNKLVTLQPAR